MAFLNDQLIVGHVFKVQNKVFISGCECIQNHLVSVFVFFSNVRFLRGGLFNHSYFERSDEYRPHSLLSEVGEGILVIHFNVTLLKNINGCLLFVNQKEGINHV